MLVPSRLAIQAPFMTEEAYAMPARDSPRSESAVESTAFARPCIRELNCSIPSHLLREPIVIRPETLDIVCKSARANHEVSLADNCEVRTCLLSHCRYLILSIRATKST